MRRPDICGPRRYHLASRAKVGIAILCTCGHRAPPLLPQLTDDLHNLGIAFSDGTIDAQTYVHKRDAYQAELAALIIPEDTQIVDGGLYLETLRDLWSAATPQEMHDICHVLFDAVYCSVPHSRITRVIPKPQFISKW